MWILILLLLTGCANEPFRQFNSEDIQDNSCYKRLGAMPGYCGK